MKKTIEETCILGFYGQSGIGKTYLVRQIVSDLYKLGKRVAVIKISDKAISIDSEGKDTYLYGQAGADTVVFSSAAETAFMVKRPLSTRIIVDQLIENDNYDYIFIEGALEEWIPKIRLGDMQERQNTLFTYIGRYEDLLEKINNKEL